MNASPAGSDACRAAVSLLWQHLDGELTPEVAEEIARHLDACPPCDERAAEYRILKEALCRHAAGVGPEELGRLRALAATLLGR